jgi:hypothetical protein
VVEFKGADNLMRLLTQKLHDKAKMILEKLSNKWHGLNGNEE